jgi:hypothetical protein
VIKSGRRVYTFDEATADEVERVALAAKAIPGVTSADTWTATLTGRAEIRLGLDVLPTEWPRIDSQVAAIVDALNA